MNILYLKLIKVILHPLPGPLPEAFSSPVVKVLYFPSVGV